MTSPPSARPPSSARRPPDLDSAGARAFVERAPHSGDPAAGRAGEGRADRHGQAAAAQREPLRPLTLRIPESLHASLLHIAANGSKSMNQFVIDALSPAVEAQVRKIEKRKELGLD